MVEKDISPNEMVKEINRLEKDNNELNDLLTKYIQAVHDLVQEGKISTYPLTYVKIEKNYKNGSLEDYLFEGGRAGGFMSNLAHGDVVESFKRADMRNSAALFRADPDGYIKAMADEFGGDVLQNILARVPVSMENEVKENF